MLDITGDDIAKLSDTDLRILVGRLVEADLLRQNMDIRGVLYGGNQDASDGGIDVLAEVQIDTAIDSFVPRKLVGYQVKKPDMNAASIIREMKPNGKLRTSISEIAEKRGAYIIVCSSGSVTVSSIKRRIEAMKSAMTECNDRDNIYLDFYDRNRLATWVRKYPAIVVWLRRIIGQQLIGWKSYEDWSSDPLKTDAEFFINAEPCLFSSTQQNKKISVMEGLNEIREKLHIEKSCVRLAGMSGVGKTRLVQALFDDRVGQKPLNKTDVIYCDIGMKPLPMPLHLAENLFAQGKRAILVIDNCSPEEHRQISDVCRKDNSKISLITIEYDVSEDLPKETEAYYLEPSSDDIIKSVIRAHRSYISENDLNVITKFSGGNFRIALALSETIKRNESISGLNDEELFQRLFYQRHEKNEDLLDTAAVLSLVYSFNSAYNSEEITILSKILNINENQIYKAIGELERRRLIQKRGIWKAVLPHAISNRLAIRALKTYPKEMLLNIFPDQKNRITYSLLHRLSLLDNNEEAIQIADTYIDRAIKNEEILDPYNDFWNSIKFFALLVPRKVLDIIDLIFQKENRKEILSSYQINLISIIRAIGYDRELYHRTCDMLIEIVLMNCSNSQKAEDALIRTGNIIWSGTEAIITDKIAVIDELINSDSGKKRALGIKTLDCMLKTRNIEVNFGFDFGIRHRDYDVRPNREEQNLYYEGALKYAADLICSGSALSNDIKSMLADRASDFVSDISLFILFEKNIRRILEITTWTEGWVACLHLVRIMKDRIPSDINERLNHLIEDIEPKTLEDKVRVFALSPKWSYRDYASYLELGGEGQKSEDFDRYVIQLGQELASNTSLMDKLFNECFTLKCASRVSFLGMGLVKGANDSRGLWNTLINAYKSIPYKNRKADMLNGYFQELSNIDITFCSEILDELVLSEDLCNEFISFQAVMQNAIGYHDRIMKSLYRNDINISNYERFAFASTGLYEDQDEFIELLEKLARKDNSVSVIISMMHTKLHYLKENNINDSKIHVYAMEFLSECNISEIAFRDDGNMYCLNEIIESCFAAKIDLNMYVEKLCCNIRQAIIDNRIYGHEIPPLLCSIIKYNPINVLSIFLPDEEELAHEIIEALGSHQNYNPNIISTIPVDLLLVWANSNDVIRYGKLSKLIIPFTKTPEIMWTKLALLILEISTEPIIILENYYTSFFPNSWSGSQAEAIRPCLKLIEILYDHENTAIMEWAKDKYTELVKEIARIEEWEKNIERDMIEKFE